MRPLQGGAIGDLELARVFIAAVLRRVGVRRWQRPKLHAVVTVPVGATALERRGLLEAAEEAGLGRTRLLGEPVAGAIGAGVDPLEPRTHMVVDIGGGTAEASAFCFGGLLAHRSTPQAGDDMTQALYQYLRWQHQVVVDFSVAEEVKVRASVEESPSLVVKGVDAATGRGRLLTVTTDEVAEAVRPVADSLIAVLTACVEELPPRASADVMGEGILLVGGGSLTLGLDKLLEAAFGFSVHRAERPLTCVAEGAAQSLLRPDLLDAFAA